MTAKWLPDDCLITAWRLPDDCLMTAWQLPNYNLITAWRLPDDCLTTAWWLPDDCLTTSLRLPDDCLTIAWQLLDNCLCTACPTPAWRLPEWKRWHLTNIIFYEKITFLKSWGKRHEKTKKLRTYEVNSLTSRDPLVYILASWYQDHKGWCVS